jgi:hypothetical protein
VATVCLDSRLHQALPIIMNDDEIERHGRPYKGLEEIDFSRIQTMFRSLALFDDMFLNMQAINITINDGFFTEQEYALLREYFELEQTPTMSAMFVSAQSQMWIFALYELLRTWRQRIRKMQSWKKSGAVAEMLDRISRDDHNLGAFMRTRHLEKLGSDPTFSVLMEAHLVAVEPVYRMTEAIRINLAKHEIQGKPNLIVRAPGLGRINMQWITNWIEVIILIRPSTVEIFLTLFEHYKFQSQ